ncbi:MAG: hypothetical protein LH609_21530 [Rudanella sp.]|nr:hypothetical protein [Rudanella sp.]
MPRKLTNIVKNSFGVKSTLTNEAIKQLEEYPQAKQVSLADIVAKSKAETSVTSLAGQA